MVKVPKVSMEKKKRYKVQQNEGGKGQAVRDQHGQYDILE